MDIIEEYLRQQNWRNWDQYLKHIPLAKNDCVIDLGCSVGGVCNAFAQQTAQVTGIDINPDFIAYSQSHSLLNQHFMCNDFTQVDYQSLAPITGIWGSFSLSYLKNPTEFINQLYGILQPGGWIALVDVSCFISGNMLPDSKHYERVKEYERESYKAGVYDFDFGAKIETILQQAGFNITYIDNNVNDAELNFDGPASPQVLRNWKARCERLVMLRKSFADHYTEICSDIIAGLQSHKHAKANNVRFVVAQKKL